MARCWALLLVSLVVALVEFLLVREAGTAPFFTLLAMNALIVQPRPLPEAVVSDSTDDKFFACALGTDCRIIVSGDKRVLAASGYEGVEVVRPRRFVERYL